MACVPALPAAAGWRLRDPGSPGGAAGAADIFDDHLPSSSDRRRAGARAITSVAPAGTERDHHGDRPGRPHRRCLCRNGTMRAQECGNKSGDACRGGDHPGTRHVTSRFDLRVEAGASFRI
jgi:hypothetical protein